MTIYYRPLSRWCGQAPANAYWLAGGWCWFTEVGVSTRQEDETTQPASDLPADVLDRLTRSRAAIAGLDMSQPRLMGILNVTPDSFSDGGRFNAPDRAVVHAREMVTAGADIIDVGGESTRPGAALVAIEEEIARTAPVVAAIKGEAVISIDTRKAPVAQAAVMAGADLINDVAATTYDPQVAKVTADSGKPICLMHAQGTPETMQDDPRYDQVVYDVYDFLAERIAAAEAAGIARDRIILDPGIGFGKTLDHNLMLLRNLSLFHALGCPILLGASRKRFIGTLGGGETASDRLGGSVAVALNGLRQGVQITRVHDTFETKQAFDLDRSINGA